MRHVQFPAWAALALLMAAAPVSAVAPVSVVMGSSRDGSLHDLQRKVDRLVGPGHVDVHADYIGAHPGDPDPWFWVNTGNHAIAITLIDRKSPHGVVGWYEETGGTPVIDGVRDGVVLEDWRLKGMRAYVRIPAVVARYGFYLEHQGGDEDADQGMSYRYYTNRLLNDAGPHGLGTMHEPIGGDMQMLVFDVSRWIGAGSWLVACEYSDSGCHVGHGRGDSDNDFSDILFLVTGVGTTPTQGTNFGGVKALFR